ncbi:extracellular catalytic domain type 2 short-chain-length polyhydroxyalkanoate depolymerase [Arsukibacterium indicum]|uniref:Polyhydroxybutyrate depolymerase n=1 Tax=Arsukibacterium indicum TaxID=2848612 RepID=A0ABS6MLV9_9GAMM|nr:PHB depolymerase family esterase [Arsukibacterium indicum]MBV2129819.1 polyhydroxybutyrate depolymerase [Arsukibacterium indicum]
MKNSLLAKTVIASLLVGTPLIAAAKPKLQLTGDITVSGLSSGGYMAVQFHLAYSDKVTGAAIIAGGPLYCAQNSLATAFANCMGKPEASPDLTAIEQYLTTLEQQQLAPRKNLQDDKVWILHGTQDTTVHPNVGKALYNQYLQWLPATSIKMVSDKPFAHHFPTDNTAGTACDVSEPPFIANCSYDAAGALLSHLLGKVNAKAANTTGSMRQVTQTHAGTHLAETGFAYIPVQCAAGEPCALHISFHGCKQHAGVVDDAFITGTGLNHYADTNNLVILYPQAVASAFNPHGCWDWWGYSTEHYITRQAPQLQAVMLLAEQLSSNN